MVKELWSKSVCPYIKQQSYAPPDTKHTVRGSMLLIADKQLRLRLQHYLCFTVRKNLFTDMFRHPACPERYIIIWTVIFYYLLRVKGIDSKVDGEGMPS